MNIVFCSAELVPFVKTGGLADVAGALPFALERLGLKIYLFIPRYQDIYAGDHEITSLQPGISTTQLSNNIQVLFIENKKLYDRAGIYGNRYGDFPDNLERFQYFCYQTLEAIKSLKIDTQIIHCHDWHTSLIPVYLKTVFKNDPSFRHTKSVLTIHNLAYQGIFPKDHFAQLKLNEDMFVTDNLEFYDQINLLKGGILFSDRIGTVSPTYAKEITTEFLGCGLEGVLRSRSDSVVGILNGIDYSLWNPEEDLLIAQQYSETHLENKSPNKDYLQKIFQLPLKPHYPLFGFVGRLSHQKGIDLIMESIDLLMEKNLQIVILGLGAQKYHRMLKEKADQYPQKLGVDFSFNEKLAHQVYAGCNFFLMPSIFEPCGLSQMISLRYGSIPVVYKTGGLADTIRPVEKDGNGIVFEQYTVEDFVGSVDEAITFYHERELFLKTVHKTMRSRFSWEDSAQEYLEMYKRCLG